MDFNLEDYDVSKIEIKKGSSYTKDEPWCDWYDVSLNIKNKYFNYNETRECLLESELWQLYHTLNKCLKNELLENKNLWFTEHDLEFEIHKSDNNHFHLMEFKILINLKGVVGCDYYSFTLGDEEIIKFRDYIGSVLKAKK